LEKKETEETPKGKKKKKRLTVAEPLQTKTFKKPVQQNSMEQIKVMLDTEGTQ